MLGFLKRILGTRESEITSHQHRQETYKTNDDVLAGERFSATLNLKTPLTYLNMHGTVVPTGEASEPERPEYGVWLPEIKSEYRIPGLPDQMTSSFGPVPIDGGKLLPLLKVVRRIVEQPVDPSRVLLVAMQRVEPVIVSFQKLGGIALFASEDDCLLFLVEEYVGSIKFLTGQHYRQLIEEFGCQSVADLADLTDQQLLSLSGIGQAKLKVLRSELEARKTQQEGHQ